MNVALGMLVGLMLGLTGAGGSVIAVPLLVFVAGLPLIDAAPIALLATCAATAFGTLLAWDRRTVRYRAAMLMAAAGAATTWFGIEAARRLDHQWLLLAFSALLSVVSLRMLQQARHVGSDDDAPHHALVALNPQTGRLIWQPRTFALFGGVGALNGLLSGMLGVGGGFMIIPALRSITPLTIHAAIATSLLTVALYSAAAVAIHTASHGLMDLRIALPFVGGALLGMAIGRRLAPRIAGPALQSGFAAVMFASAAYMAYSALS